MRNPDIVVIGAGIAGTSAAAELAHTHSVVVPEQETALGYDTTGRSAALSSEAYGNALVRVLSRASRNLFSAPLQGFSDCPQITPRGALQIARADQADVLAEMLANAEGAALSHATGQGSVETSTGIYHPSIVGRAHNE